MNPKEYVKNVLVTEARDMAPLQERFSQTRNIRLLHGAIGLASELAESQELVEKQDIDVTNLKEEMGDMFWYMGIMVDELKVDPDTIFQFNDTDKIQTSSANEAKAMLQDQIHGLAKEIGTAIDLLKKAVMYGKQLDEAKLADRLRAIDYYVNRSLRIYGLTSAASRERNIEKLRARYGEKFTEAAALERNLAAERQILEKS